MQMTHFVAFCEACVFITCSLYLCSVFHLFMLRS